MTEETTKKRVDAEQDSGEAPSKKWYVVTTYSTYENKVKVAPDTQFRIGTASTVLTSAASGLLLERDRLKLD